MKILIVKYLPSGDHSHTLQLLNHFKKYVGSHQVEEVDLIKNLPMVHNEASMLAYKKRNFGGETLSADLAQAIAPMDKLAQQFVAADVVVLVTPMHNFSLPGVVKTYFDAVLQSGVAFTYKDGQQIGLMSKTKFLTLYTSMGSYKGEYGFMDNLKTIVKIELDFVGIKGYEFIQASTGNPTTYEMFKDKALSKIDTIAQKWLS